MALSVEQMNQMFGKPGTPIQPPTPQRPSDAEIGKIFGVSTKTSILPQKQVIQPTQRNDFLGGLKNAASAGLGAFTGQNPIATKQAITEAPDLNVGAAKGALNSSQNLAEVTRPLTNPSLNMQLNAVRKASGNSEAGKIPKEFTTPSNDVQSIGYGAEQIAEFALPQGIVSKGGKAAEVATAATKLPGLVKTGLNTVAKAGLEGITSGGVAALQKGEIDDDVKNTALFSAALPVVGTVGKMIADPVKRYAGKVIPEKMIAKLIRPDKNAYLFGKNPAAAVAQEKIVASSFDNLVKKIGGKKDEIGSMLAQHVDEAVKANPGNTVDVSAILQKHADEFEKKVTDQGMWKAFADRVGQLSGDFKGDIATGELKRIAEKDLTKMNAKQIWEMQRKVGQLTQWTGAGYDKQINQALHGLYSDLGKTLDNVAPGSKVYQTRWANMLGAEKAASARAAVVARNSNIVSAGIGAGVANLVLPGETLKDRMINTFAGSIIPGIKNHPAFRTRLSKLLISEGASSKEVTLFMDLLKNVGKSGAKYGVSTSKQEEIQAED